jgi:hypothetical protein
VNTVRRPQAPLSGPRRDLTIPALSDTNCQRQVEMSGRLIRSRDPSSPRWVRGGSPRAPVVSEGNVGHQFRRSQPIFSARRNYHGRWTHHRDGEHPLRSKPTGRQRKFPVDSLLAEAPRFRSPPGIGDAAACRHSIWPVTSGRDDGVGVAAARAGSGSYRRRSGL